MSALALHSISFARMEPSQRETKEWLKAVAKHLNLSPSQLALASGLAASTVTRFTNDMSGKATITQASLEKISQYSGFRPGQLPGRSRGNTVAPDTVPLHEDANVYPKWVLTAIDAAKGGRNGVEAWVMKGAALDGIGVMPGDIIIIDMNARAKTGDVVLATVIDPMAGSTEAVMRLYQKPFITTHSLRLGPGRPEHVDDDRISIVGVMIATIRVQH